MNAHVFNILIWRERNDMLLIMYFFPPIKMFRLFCSYILFPFPILQLGISSHENATPVKLIHNSAGHLNGPARTVGATLIGYLGESDCLTEFQTSLFAFKSAFAFLTGGQVFKLIFHSVLAIFRDECNNLKLQSTLKIITF